MLLALDLIACPKYRGADFGVSHNMSSRMILMRAGKSPFQVFSHAESVAIGPSGVFGANAGNLLFAGSVHRSLSVPNVVVDTDGFVLDTVKKIDRAADQLNTHYDHLVLPFANAFRFSFVDKLERWSALIERLKIPVTVVGIGAQMRLNQREPEGGKAVAESVQRFVSAVLNRGPSIGVRGEMTRDYLATLGFSGEEVSVIGCPSLFDAVDPVTVSKETDALSVSDRISLNVTGGLDNIVTHNAAKYPRLEFIAQEHHRLKLLLYGENPDEYRMTQPFWTGHRLYTEDRIRFFVDEVSWIDYLRNFRFSFGSRIHGNIAALRAGTPAMVLAYDSRTLELARLHKIPYRILTDANVTIDADDLYQEADFHAFNRESAVLTLRYRGFLASHGLAHIWQPGCENPDYAARLESLRPPGPVHTLHRRSLRNPLGRMMRVRSEPMQPISNRRNSEYVARVRSL